MNIVWISYGLSNLFILFTMLIVMPNLETNKVKPTLFIISLLPLIILIINGIFLEDSPRNLILQRQNEKAFEILEEYNGEKLNETEKNTIINEVFSEENKCNPELKEIFTPRLRKTSILLALAWFFCEIYLGGCILILSLTLKKLMGTNEHLITNRDITIGQIIVVAFNTPCQLVAILTEFKTFGRNKTNMILMAIGLVFVLFACFFPQNFSVLIGLFCFFSGASYNILSSYSCEVYPTRLRDQAMGFMYGCTMLGGALAQLFYIQLNNLYVFAPYYFTAGLMVIYILLIYLLPFETYGVPLDVDITHTKYEDVEFTRDEEKTPLIMNQS
jgi:hypothetical protein